MINNISTTHFNFTNIDTNQLVLTTKYLQDMLLSLNKENVQICADKISKTVFLKTKKGIYILIHNIFDILDIRQKKIQEIACLLSILCSSKLDENLPQNLFKRCLWKFFFSLKHSPKLSIEKITHLFLLFLYYKSIGFSEQDIFDGVSFHFRQCNINEVTFPLLFLYFGDIVCKKDSTLHAQMKITYNKVIQHKTVFKDSPSKNVTVIRENNYQSLSNSILKGEFPDPYFFPILNDNVEEFKKLFLDGDRDVYHLIDNSVFIPGLHFVKEINILEFASMHGSSEIFNFLMQNGYNIEQDAKDELSLIELACYGGNMKIIRSLLDGGLNLSNGIYHCLRGWQNCALNILVGLYQNGNDVLKINSACFTNNIDCLISMVSNGYDINSVDEYGLTPLYYALSGAKYEASRYLLSIPHINASIKDNFGMSCLHIAAEFGEEDIIRHIHNLSPQSLNSPNNLGFTPLIIGASSGKLTSVRTFLSLPDIDVNIGSRWGLTALHIAVSKGFVDIVRELVNDSRVNVNAVESYLKTPLHLCCEQGMSDCADILLSSSLVDINACDSEGWTPLHLCSENGHLKNLTSLLNFQKLSVNAKDCTGQTALHLAARNGKRDCVIALLKRPDIIVYERDNRNKTAYNYAAIYDHKDVVNVITDYVGSTNISDPDDIEDSDCTHCSSVSTLDF